MIILQLQMLILKSNEVIKKILSQTKHWILSEEDKDDSKVDYQKRQFG